MRVQEWLGPNKGIHGHVHLYQRVCYQSPCRDGAGCSAYCWNAICCNFNSYLYQLSKLCNKFVSLSCTNSCQYGISAIDFCSSSQPIHNSAPPDVLLFPSRLHLKICFWIQWSAFSESGQMAVVSSADHLSNWNAPYVQSLPACTVCRTSPSFGHSIWYIVRLSHYVDDNPLGLWKVAKYFQHRLGYLYAMQLTEVIVRQLNDHY